MKKVKDFIKQKSTILQLMFVASVLILVLVEISKIMEIKTKIDELFWEKYKRVD